MPAGTYLEPLIVFSILTGGVLFNRRRSTDDCGRDGTWSPGSTSSFEGLLSEPVLEPQWRERIFFGKGSTKQKYGTVEE